MHVVLKRSNTSPLSRSLTQAKPAAQQMTVGDVPEEQKVRMGEFLCFDVVEEPSDFMV